VIITIIVIMEAILITTVIPIQTMEKENTQENLT